MEIEWSLGYASGVEKKTWADAYMRLDIDPEKRLVRQTRSSRVYEDIPTMTQSIESILEQLREIDRAEYVLLQDLRAARGRNDREFESVMVQARPRLSQGFRRLAVVVATNIGRLQVQRYFERDTPTACVFLDEKKALRWLLAE